jgi:hypothetical protein
MSLLDHAMAQALLAGPEVSAVQVAGCRDARGVLFATLRAHIWDRRDRISAISSITVSPKNRSLNLYFDLMPDNVNVHGEDVVEYLRHLKAHLAGPMTIL